MKRHFDAGDGWKKVGNRKDAPVTLYVSNLPEDASYNGLKSIFQQFGKIVDIYISKRKDNGGTLFAFIRFSGIQDAKRFEQSIGVLRYGHCILRYNLARYQRKNAGGTHAAAQPHRVPARPSFHHSHHTHKNNGARGIFTKGMSYANVVKGNCNDTSVSKGLSLSLSPSQTLTNHLQSFILVGEILDMNKLRNIPMLMMDAGISGTKVYYYGGLHVLIYFDRSSNANGFLENSDFWKSWFKWLKRGDQATNLQFQRLAWLRIIGLPLHFRDCENIKKIAAEFGELIETTDIRWESHNLSNVKLAIMTSSKLRINEEMTISHGDNVFQIGISEIYFDWQPFSTHSFSMNPTKPGELDDDALGHDSESNSDGEDGISDTWEYNQDDNEKEDGEFIPNDQDDLFDKVVDEMPVDVSFPANDGGNTVNGTKVFSGIDASVNVVNSNSDNIVVEESFTSPVVDCAVGTDFPVDDNVGASTLPNGPIFNFGPFPSSVPTGLHNNFNYGSFMSGNVHPDFRFASASKKRRRFSPIRPSSAPIIDLNRTASPVVSCNSIGSSQSQLVPEITKTAEIGVKVGFQISDGDPTLREILSGDGVKTVSL